MTFLDIREIGEKAALEAKAQCDDILKSFRRSIFAAKVWVTLPSPSATGGAAGNLPSPGQPHSGRGIL